MKKNFKYAILNAIAVVGAVSFSACQSSDEIVDNPNYNPEDNTVKTQFAISLPSNYGKATRMGATEVQKTGNFQGMEKAIIIPLKASTVTSSTTSWGKTINLGALTVAEFTTANAWKFEDVTVPTQTNRFIFYGLSKATYADSDNPTAAEKFQYGRITEPAFTATDGAAGTALSGSFGLESIFSGSTDDAQATNLCNYIQASIRGSRYACCITAP